MKPAKELELGNLIALRLQKPGDAYAKVYEVEVIRLYPEKGDRYTIDTAAGSVTVGADEMIKIVEDTSHIDRDRSVRLEFGPKLKKGERSTW